MSNAISLLTASLFRIETFSFKDFSAEQAERIKRIVVNWKTIAQVLAQREPSAQPIFEDASSVAQNLINHLMVLTEGTVRSLHSEMSAELILCKDASESVQAMSIVQSSLTQINIKCLLTRPQNIRSPLNEHTRVAGAGSAIIHYLKERMEKSESIQMIALTALSSAVRFYEKHNFLNLGDLHFSPFADDERRAAEVVYTEMIFPRSNTNKKVA